MKARYYRMIEKYLYHYYEPEVLVQEVRDYYISRMNYSKTTWLKGYNTLENQAIKLMDSRELKEIREWVAFLKKVLTFFYEENSKYYNFINYKYFQKKKKSEIMHIFELDYLAYTELNMKIIEDIYSKAVLEGLIEEGK